MEWNYGSTYQLSEHPSSVTYALVLSIKESYLPTLKDKLRKMVPDYIIEPDYNPTESNVNEVEEFGYETSRILRTITFRDTAERMKHKPWLKVALFTLTWLWVVKGEMVVLGDDEEIDIVENKGE